MTNGELLELGRSLTVLQMLCAMGATVDLGELMQVNEDGEIKARIGPEAIRIAKRILETSGLETMDFLATASGIRIKLFERETGAIYLVKVESVR